MIHAVGLPVPSSVIVRERFTPEHSDDMAARIDAAIAEGSLDPEVRAIADAVTSEHDWRDHSGATVALLRWVQSRVRYAEDPDRADLVQHPSYTLGRRSGDCVAQTVLLGSLLRARGVKVSPLYVDPDGGGIAHVLLKVEPADGAPLVVDPIDYAAPVGYVPRGRLFLSRGDGRAVPVEGSSMLAVTPRREVRGYGSILARRGVGMIRAVGQGTTAPEEEAKKEEETTDYVLVGLGGALAAMGTALLGDQSGKKPAIDPKTGQLVYTPQGRQAPPVAPAASTVFGLPLFAALGIAGLILWALTRRRRSR